MGGASKIQQKSFWSAKGGPSPQKVAWSAKGDWPLASENSFTMDLVNRLLHYRT
jgi:hypothetical protein